MNNKSPARKIALASVLSALCFLMLFIGSVITVMDLSAAALASLVVVIATIEIKSYYPYLIWIVTSILGFLLLPDKFGTIVFACFAGYYPMLKSGLERFSPIVSRIAKILAFNVALTAILALSKYVFFTPDTELGFSVAVYGVCNIVFILFDIALTKMIGLYIVKLRSKLFKN